MKSARFVTIILTGVVSFIGPAPIAAQGIGHGQPVDPVRHLNSTTTITTQPSQPSTSATAGQIGTGSRLQRFGSWLDTAGVSAPGEAWISMSSAYWRSSSMREVDVPAMGITV